MLKRYLPLALLACAGLSACKDGSQHTMQGYYTLGPKIEAFQPCGERAAYWVIGLDTVLNPLRAFVARQAGNDGRPVRAYVEVRTHDAGQADGGPAANYDSIYVFDRVLRMRADAPPDCKLPI